MGRDHTIYSVVEGWVYFKLDKERNRQTVSVLPVNPNHLTQFQRNWIWGIMAKRNNITEAKLLADKFRHQPLLTKQQMEELAAEAKKESESAQVVVTVSSESRVEDISVSASA